MLVLAGLAGAAVGWGIFTAKTPQYQAEGTIAVGIDFTRTGQLSDIEEDQMLGIIGDILVSPDVITAVIEGAGDRQIGLDEDTFKQITRAERRQNQWVLIVRHPDAATAQALAELWTRAGYSQLVTSMGHAERAGHLQRYLDALESCLQHVAGSNPAAGLCGIKDLPGLQKELETAGALMIVDKTAGMGMLPGTTITLASLPQHPEGPAVFKQGQLVLAGCLAGLLLGAAGLSAGWTDRLHRFRPA